MKPNEVQVNFVTIYARIDERRRQRAGKYNELVAGHGRIDTLTQRKDRGDSAPKRIEVKRTADGEKWFVPVIRGVEFSSPVEAERYLVADNRHTELGGWHNDILRDTLKSFLKEEGLRGTGYDEDDVDAMEEDDVPYSDEGDGVGTEKREVECPRCELIFTPK